MLGDDNYGTQNGVITKRGYVLAHYSKFVTGATRIEDTWDTNALGGSSYLSVTGDSVVVVVINSSKDDYSLTVDLPFYPASGTCITTTEAANMNLKETAVNMGCETCYPEVTINALSVTTLVFTKNGEGHESVGQLKDTPVVLSKEYYTLMGQKVSSDKNNLKGIYIVKSFMSNGSVTSRKIFRQ